MAAAALLSVQTSFDQFLDAEKAKDLLRFTTAGSVDDGKSTLIGRLLYDSRNVYDDQLESVTKASVGRNAGIIDFSLLTDGLRAEREQGITIDVAYRYFATPRRKFIIADTPGHEQYTRNMVTGASTADLAIILVDARKGLLPQSRRHAYIAALLGLPQVCVAVNKMDLVGYDQTVFRNIEKDFLEFFAHGEMAHAHVTRGRLGAVEPMFIPISALAGDNVVRPSGNMRWYDGPTLLAHLEQVPVGNRPQNSAFRFPVQRVARPNQEFRGYAGTVASGHIQVGDPVTIFPSRRESTIAGISTFDGELPSASAGQAITLTLRDEIDIARGDLLAALDEPPHVSNAIQATLVWLNEAPANPSKHYLLKHAGRQDRAELKQIKYRINIGTLQHERAETLEMNAIGVVEIETARPLWFDVYTKNRVTGSFILIDPTTNATVAAGMISGAVASAAGTASSTGSRVDTWQIRDGALVLSLPGEAADTDPHAIEDPATLEILGRLLQQLRIR